MTPFVIPPGMTNDDTIFAAPGRWANGSLVRFWEGSWQLKGGWERLTMTNLGGVCRSVLGWSDTDDNQNLIAFGLHNGLKVWEGSILYDITPTAFTDGSIDGTGGAGYGAGVYGGAGGYGTPSPADTYFPLTWSLANWGGDLMASPRGQSIFWWRQDTSVIAAPLTGAPAKITYMLVAPQRQVMAFGCNEETSGVFNPLAIRWSDIEDPTDWTTSPSNNAGEWVLESGGRIVTARVLGDYILVWTAVSLFLGTFVGTVGETWKFEKIGDHCGSISPGAPVIVSQTAAWISADHVFWNYSLGGAPTPLDCPIRLMFMNNVVPGQEDKIIGGSTSTFNEITWWWPDSRDGAFECSRSLTVNGSGWSRDLMARSAYVDAGPHGYPIGVSPDGWAYWHEKGNSADGQPLVGYIESSAFYLDDAAGGVLVNGVWPDFKSQQGPLTMTVYVREFPQSPERTHGPWTLAPGQSLKSFRLAGRIARVRFDWNSAPAFARGGKCQFDVQSIGGR